MSWGTELWDQTDSIAAYVQKGIEFCEKFSHFLREKCSLENEYASKLKRLVKSYQPKRKDEDCEFTCTRGFQEMISEITDMAGQHEWIAENLTNSTMKSLHLLIQQIKNDKRKYLQENSKQNSNMQTQWQQLDKFKKQYEKAFRESEKARELFNKADADINLSRAEVEKARSFMTQKQQACDNAKSEYGAELQKTNDYQREHFGKLIPEIIQRLQDLEESRINSMTSLYKECADTERKVMPIVSKCIDGMEKASSLVSSSTDIKVVIDKYKSGFLPPGDIAFEELSSDNSSSSEKISPSASISSLTRGDAGKSKPTVAPVKAKKKTNKILGLFSGSKNDEVKEDFSHLPPNQQKKKLIQQINSIKALVSKEVAERDALLKMQDTYQRNPLLGDAQSLEKQLEEGAQKLDQLHSELRKFQKYLADIDGTAPNQETLSTNPSATKNLSNSEDNFQPVLPSSKEEQDNHCLQSLVFGIQDISFSGSDMNLNFAEFDKAKDCPSDASDGSFDGPDETSGSGAAVSIGLGTALYSFTADNEHSLSMAVGEQFTILEQDQGDGWMRVRNSSGAEGYVPSSYMQCQ